MSCISVARHRCGFHRCLQQIQQDSPANRSTSCWALSAVFHCRALSHGVLCFLSWVEHCTGEFVSARSRSLNSACRSPDLARRREERSQESAFLAAPPSPGWCRRWLGANFLSTAGGDTESSKSKASTLFQKRHSSRQFPCSCSLSKAPNPLIDVQLPSVTQGLQSSKWVLKVNLLVRGLSEDHAWAVLNRFFFFFLELLYSIYKYNA